MAWESALMTTMTDAPLVSAIGSLLTGIGTFGLAVTALCATKSWKKEMTARARHEAAEHILSETWRFSDSGLRIPSVLEVLNIQISNIEHCQKIGHRNDGMVKVSAKYVDILSRNTHDAENAEKNIRVRLTFLRLSKTKVDCLWQAIEPLQIIVRELRSLVDTINCGHIVEDNVYVSIESLTGSRSLISGHDRFTVILHKACSDCLTNITDICNM